MSASQPLVFLLIWYNNSKISHASIIREICCKLAYRHRFSLVIDIGRMRPLPESVKVQSNFGDSGRCMADTERMIS